MKLRVASIILLVLLTGGCSHYRAVNTPLETWSDSYGYGLSQVATKRPAGDVLLVLAFSGGGTRASALSYGVLRELRATKISSANQGASMLDEVDIISSVSGGSFTSAYYGLFGDRIFEDYEDRFLRYDVDSYLFWQIMRPWNWYRLSNTFFDRSELAIELYNKRIFDDASFAELNAADGPLVMINSTDLGDGRPFTFVQPQFDLLCSDLGKLKVARAVTASSAVPVVFSPLTLRNYAGTCGFPPPDWLEEDLAEPQSHPRRYVNAEAVAGYLDSEKRKYIHLIDGGISDNLGLRVLLDDVILYGGLWKTIGKLQLGRPRHIVVVVVDASTHPDTDMGHTAAAPSLVTVVNSITDIQLHNYNFETVELMREGLARWAQIVPPSKDSQPVQTHLVDITFDSIKDPKERHYFNQIETSLALDDETVDRLIEMGARLLRESPDYQKLMRALNGSTTEPAKEVSDPE